MKTITLWNLQHLALIIECQSGVIYKNQVGGYLCHQAETEGVLAIICDPYKEALDQLSSLTLNNREGFTEGDVMRIDQALRSNPCTCFLSMDKNRLKESKEAWLHVDINGNSFDNEIDGFSGHKGILTWENSD